MARRARQLIVDVAITSVACAVDECGRIVVPGEALHTRKVEGTALHEPLCAVCAAAALEDMKLLARIEIHQLNQRESMLAAMTPEQRAAFVAASSR